MSAAVFTTLERKASRSSTANAEDRKDILRILLVNWPLWLSWTDTAPAELWRAAQQMYGFEKPSKRNYNSLRSWIYTNMPLDESEESVFYMKEDFVALKLQKELDSLEQLLEIGLHSCPRFIRVSSSQS